MNSIKTEKEPPSFVQLEGKLFRLSNIGYCGYTSYDSLHSYLIGPGRIYSPDLLHFLAPDRLSPFGAAGENRFVYCRLDPINNSDPSGLLSEEAKENWRIGLAAFSILQNPLFGTLNLLNEEAFTSQIDKDFSEWWERNEAAINGVIIGVAAIAVGTVIIIVSGGTAAPFVIAALCGVGIALGVVGVGLGAGSIAAREQYGDDKAADALGMASYMISIAGLTIASSAMPGTGTLNAAKAGRAAGISAYKAGSSLSGAIRTANSVTRSARAATSAAGRNATVIGGLLRTSKGVRGRPSHRAFNHGRSGRHIDVFGRARGIYRPSTVSRTAPGKDFAGVMMSIGRYVSRTGRGAGRQIRVTGV